MRDNPVGRFNSETICNEPGCGLCRGHKTPHRGELPDGDLLVIDQNGESSDATKGSGQGSFKLVRKSQIKHRRGQEGRIAL